MEKKLPSLLIVTALAFGLGACAQAQRQSVLNNPPGKYEETVSSTNAQGTTTKQQSSTEVTVDAYGNKTAVVKSKTTQDPVGLFNTTTTDQSKQVIEEK